MAYRAIVGIYGLLNVLGGLAAYLMPTVRSVMSLVVGGVTGLALLGCAAIAAKNPGLAYRTAGGISALLAAFWVYRIATLAQEGKSVGMAAGNLVLSVAVLAALGIGHMAAQKKAS